MLRIIDRSTMESMCPYCDTSVQNRNLKILFQDKDQSVVRKALGKLSGFEGDASERRKISSDTDPLSSLVYRYERCDSSETKMELLADGLTEIYGTFTLDDIEKIDPKNGKALLRAMLSECYISEVKYGKYRA